VGGAIWVAVRTKRQRSRPLAKARRLRWAVARMIAHPDDVARSRPSVGKKALSAFVSAVAGVLAKILSQRLFARIKPAPSHG
jgi:hypothetical protein